MSAAGAMGHVCPAQTKRLCLVATAGPQAASLVHRRGPGRRGSPWPGPASLGSRPSGLCLVQPAPFSSLFLQVDGILKTVLRDEIIAWHKKTQEDTSSPLSAAGQPENMDSQQLVSLVQKAVTAIMTRLHNLAQFEGGESKVNTLVAAANSLDNLCRMDPAWHPWL